jgi:hypothetical protein
MKVKHPCFAFAAPSNSGICTTLRTVCRLPPPPITSHPPLITLPPPFLLSGSRFRRKALRSTLPRRKARRQPHSHAIPPPSPRRSPARPPFPSRPRPTSVSVAAASRRTPTLALRPTSVSVAAASRRTPTLALRPPLPQWSPKTSPAHLYTARDSRHPAYIPPPTASA